MTPVNVGNPIKNQLEMGVINIYAQKLLKKENNAKMKVYVIANIVDFIIKIKYYNN
jgi:hypothetical protein